MLQCQQRRAVGSNDWIFSAVYCKLWLDLLGLEYEGGSRELEAKSLGNPAWNQQLGQDNQSEAFSQLDFSGSMVALICVSRDG